MIKNFYLRYFNFMGSLTRLMTIYSTWAPQNHNDVYLNMIQAGREIGKGARIVFDFQMSDKEIADYSIYYG